MRQLELPSRPEVKWNMVYQTHSGRLEVMDPFFLDFRINPTMERNFKRVFQQRYRRYTQVVLSIIFLLVVLYSIYVLVSVLQMAEAETLDLSNRSNFTAIYAPPFGLRTGPTADDFNIKESDPSGNAFNIFRLVICVVVLIIFVPYSNTRLYEDYFQATLMTVAIVGSIIKAVAINDSGAMAAVLAPIVFYFLVALRLRNAFIVAVCDFFIYNFVLMFRRSMDSNVIFKNDVFILVLEFACFYAAHQKELDLRMDFLNNIEVEERKKQSSGLLDNILPRAVTAELSKASEAKTAKAVSQQDSVSVLFCNIHDFQSLVINHQPWQLVTLLDSIYTAFDEIAEDNGVEKMETVGEVYVACGGLNRPHGTHAVDCVNMAIDMLRVMKQFRTQDDKPVNVRIGINSGPVRAAR